MGKFFCVLFFTLVLSTTLRAEVAASLAAGLIGGVASGIAHHLTPLKLDQADTPNINPLNENCAWISFHLSSPRKADEALALFHVTFGVHEKGYKKLRLMGRYSGSASVEDTLTFGEDGKVHTDLGANMSVVFKCCPLTPDEVTTLKSGYLNMLNNSSPEDATKDADATLSQQKLGAACYDNATCWLKSLKRWDAALSQSSHSMNGLYDFLRARQKSDVNGLSCSEAPLEENLSSSGTAKVDNPVPDSTNMGEKDLPVVYIKLGKKIAQLPPNVQQQMIQGIRYDVSQFGLGSATKDTPVEEESHVYVEAELVDKAPVQRDIAPYTDALVERTYKIKKLYSLDMPSSWLDIASGDDAKPKTAEEKKKADDAESADSQEKAKAELAGLSVKEGDTITVLERSYQRRKVITKDDTHTVGQSYVFSIGKVPDRYKSLSISNVDPQYPAAAYFSDSLVGVTMDDIKAAEKVGAVKIVPIPVPQ